MSWIKKQHLLPGDERYIQLWNEADKFGGQPSGNVIGTYSPKSGKWFGRDTGKELTYVTHWAELLGKPED